MRQGLPEPPQAPRVVSPGDGRDASSIVWDPHELIGPSDRLMAPTCHHGGRGSDDKGSRLPARASIFGGEVMPRLARTRPRSAIPAQRVHHISFALPSQRPPFRLTRGVRKAMMKPDVDSRGPKPRAKFFSLKKLNLLRLVVVAGFDSCLRRQVLLNRKINFGD